jgi:hypothetical protein
MLSIVDATGAAAQVGSVLADAAADATGHVSSSIVVGAASSSSGVGERKRVRRSDLPDLDDAQCGTMMQQRRKHKEKLRDRDRDRTERSFPALEQQRQKQQKYLAG